MKEVLQGVIESSDKKMHLNNLILFISYFYSHPCNVFVSAGDYF